MPESTPIHNIFVKGHFAHISYYKDGYVVLDISDPTNPQLAGWYDTYPSPSGTYEGAWGCYPYFPSGTVVISDINTGLYVFDFLGDNTPVELTSFSYKLIDDNVLLNWSTATETNNQGFQVERSKDKSKWSTIGFIKGSGNSTTTKKYEFLDKSPSIGLSYYRLVQKDFDGKQKIYSPLEINYLGPLEYSLKQNYPNPFNPSTNIEFTMPKDDHVNLSIYNMLGQKVYELINENMQGGKHKVSFTGDNLPSGIYIAKLNAGEFNGYIKMNLIK